MTDQCNAPGPIPPLKCKRPVNHTGAHSSDHAMWYTGPATIPDFDDIPILDDRPEMRMDPLLIAVPFAIIVWGAIFTFAWVVLP
jgi:hypothetical protein